MTFSIFPRTVYKTKSKISGPIEVEEQLGRYTLHVQGMIQSGGVVRGAWKKALNRITYHVSPASPSARRGRAPITNVLVLGLGGGTVVEIIDKMFLKAKIVGIEIDPEIIKIAKKYFGLNEIKNLQIIQADAFDWVTDCLKNTKTPRMVGETPARWADALLGGEWRRFNLVIVDLYIGDKFPKKAESKEFLNNLKELLSKDGVAIFNRLKTDDMKLEIFKKNLEKHFSRLDLIKTSTNLFFAAR